MPARTTTLHGIEVDVTYAYTRPTKAPAYCGTDRDYPPEPGEVDIQEVWHEGEDIRRLLSDECMTLLAEKIEALEK